MDLETNDIEIDWQRQDALRHARRMHIGTVRVTDGLDYSSTHENSWVPEGEEVVLYLGEGTYTPA